MPEPTTSIARDLAMLHRHGFDRSCIMREGFLKIRCSLCTVRFEQGKWLHEKYCHNRTSVSLSLYRLVWSPEGKTIDTVLARTARAAIRKAPKPYRKYLGEIYAEEV